MEQTLLRRLDEQIDAARDPERAAAMEAYMRDLFPFAGIPAPAMRRIGRTVRAGLGVPGDDQLARIAEACWSRDDREYQYFACDLLRACPPGPDLLPLLHTLITTKSWWDTVDPLATRVVGDLARRHPAVLPTLDAWSADDDKWLVRTAILHQLHYGAATDTGRLFGYCARQAGHPDFFVRKAIGWALRQYARTEPGEVRAFVAEQGGRLSPLSVREATKHL